MALGVVVFDYALFGRALPVLVALACPLSMLVMMRTMRSGTAASPGCAHDPAGQAPTVVEQAEIARLRAEIAALRTEAASSPEWSGNAVAGTEASGPRT